MYSYFNRYLSFFLLGLRNKKIITAIVLLSSAILIPTFSSHLSSNQLDRLRATVTILTIGISFAIWYGVYLERHGNPEPVQHRGWRIVAIALLAETWSIWALWQIDNAISDKKDAQITILQKALAPRNLSDDQIKQIADQLAPFSGRLYSGIVSPGTPDSIPLWLMIDKALQTAHWTRAVTPEYLGVAGDTATVAYAPGTNVSVFAPYKVEGSEVSGSSPEIDEAAATLTRALLSAGIKVEFFRSTAKPDIELRGIIVSVGPKVG